MLAIENLLFGLIIFALFSETDAGMATVVYACAIEICSGSVVEHVSIIGITRMVRNNLELGFLFCKIPLLLPSARRLSHVFLIVGKKLMHPAT